MGPLCPVVTLLPTILRHCEMAHVGSSLYVLTQQQCPRSPNMPLAGGQQRQQPDSNPAGHQKCEIVSATAPHGNLEHQAAHTHTTVIAKRRWRSFKTHRAGVGERTVCIPICKSRPNYCLAPILPHRPNSNLSFHGDSRGMSLEILNIKKDQGRQVDS